MSAAKVQSTYRKANLEEESLLKSAETAVSKQFSRNAEVRGLRLDQDGRELRSLRFVFSLVGITEFDPRFDPGSRRFPARFRRDLTQEFVLLDRENICLYPVVGQEPLEGLGQHLIFERTSAGQRGAEMKYRSGFLAHPIAEKSVVTRAQHQTV